MCHDAETDAIKCFPRSQNREDIFETLLDGPCDVRTIKEETGLPRTTVRDNLNTMQTLGWVDTTDAREYAPTPAGRVAYESFQEYRDGFRVSNRFEPLFEYVDPDALDFSFDLLLDADLITPTEQDPLAPSTRLATLAADADHLRGFLAVVDPGTLLANGDRIDNGDLTYELVAKPSVFEKLTETYGAPGASNQTDNDIHIFQGEFPFGIALFDDHLVTIYGFDRMNGTRVLVESDTDQLIDWGVDTFESFKRRATPISQLEEF